MKSKICIHVFLNFGAKIQIRIFGQMLNTNFSNFLSMIYCSKSRLFSNHSLKQIGLMSGYPFKLSLVFYDPRETILKWLLPPQGI